MAPGAKAKPAVSTRPLPVQLLEKQLKSADPETRAQGLDTITTLKVPAESLAESFAELLQNDNLYIKQTAAEAIARTSQATNRSCLFALDLVDPMMKHEQHEIRRQVADTMLRVTQRAPEGEPLPGQLPPESFEGGKKKKVLPPAPAAAAKLAGWLEDKDAKTRQRAVETLTQMGPLAAPYCRQFAFMLADQDIHVRNAVIQAFTILGTEAAGGIEKAGEKLAHVDPAVRRSAAKAMIALAAHSGPDAAAATASQLSNPDPAVRLVTAEVMKSMGPLATPHASALIRLLRDRSPRVREAAARALTAAGPKVVACIKDIKTALVCDNVEVRNAAEAAMKGLSWQAAHFAAAAASMLREHQSEDDGLVFQVHHRVHALHILSGAQTNAIPYLTDIANELDRSDWALRRAAMECLEDLGEHAQKAAKEVAKRLNSHDRDIRRACAETLGRMGKHTGIYGQQLPAILKMEADPHVCKACEDAIKKLIEAGVLQVEEDES